jgi:hypothetical protein
MEKGAKSRGSERYSKIGFLVRQNLRHEAILPSSDLLTESLAHQRRSDGSAIEQDGINAGATTQEFGKMSRYRTI